MRAEYYDPIIPDVVFSLGGSAGHILGILGEDVHLSNRFFIGGDNLRGFQFGGIGPRDSETDDRLGGNLYYVGSAEMPFAVAACPRSCASSVAVSSTPARCATST